ncbi:hypothetical protein GCK72_005003 [Caenorhabditis remanei]|uniref:Uncharacterized protein n=1 Tax=Caenorhabditis remanei TaxID=31234 RepID=A0A6A5HFW3_CAERE|nr:hypothetical protein GCK72_005003 [Caenorhabditis remanei]KAF1765052.1 hypothetical protein GCK72_005003 [Caenorhabditis remanei]
MNDTRTAGDFTDLVSCDEMKEAPLETVERHNNLSHLLRLSSLSLLLFSLLLFEDDEEDPVQHIDIGHTQHLTNGMMILVINKYRIHNTPRYTTISVAIMTPSPIELIPLIQGLSKYSMTWQILSISAIESARRQIVLAPWPTIAGSGMIMERFAAWRSLTCFIDCQVEKSIRFRINNDGSREIADTRSVVEEYQILTLHFIVH